MASDPQSIIWQIQLGNYICVLTFFNEVEYVWLRYLGLLVVMNRETTLKAAAASGLDLIHDKELTEIIRPQLIVLGILLLGYIPTTAFMLVLTGIKNNPKTHLSGLCY
ncbi:hypothetical protein BU15DRAFT_66240 [Melanogaster broomeanus]|nr:hypothetical protein BU15DRAFT_66240 [Melanogaster broomeanus]